MELRSHAFFLNVVLVGSLKEKVSSRQRTASGQRKSALLPLFAVLLRGPRGQRAIRTASRICLGCTKRSFALLSTCGKLSMEFRCCRSWQSKVNGAERAFIGYELQIRSKCAGLHRLCCGYFPVLFLYSSWFICS